MYRIQNTRRYINASYIVPINAKDAMVWVVFMAHVFAPYARGRGGFGGVGIRSFGLFSASAFYVVAFFLLFGKYVFCISRMWFSLCLFVDFALRSILGLYVTMGRSLEDVSHNHRVHSIWNDKPSLEVRARATAARLDNASRPESVKLKRRANSTRCVKCDSGSMAVGAGGVYIGVLPLRNA